MSQNKKPLPNSTKQMKLLKTYGYVLTNLKFELGCAWN